MKQTKYLKIEVSGTKKEIEQYFEFIESAEGVKITDIEPIIDSMLKHAQEKKKAYWKISKDIYHFYDSQQKTLEDLKSRLQQNLKK